MGDYYFQFYILFSDKYWQNRATRIVKNLQFLKLGAAEGIGDVQHKDKELF